MCQRRVSADGADVWVRVDSSAAAGMDLEVEMRCARVAGLADGADLLALRDRAVAACEAQQVCVVVLRAAVAGDPGGVAAQAVGKASMNSAVDRNASVGDA